MVRNKAITPSHHINSCFVVHVMDENMESDDDMVHDIAIQYCSQCVQKVLKNPSFGTLSSSQSYDISIHPSSVLWFFGDGWHHTITKSS